MKTPMSLNGVDLGQLNERIESITNDPGLARCEFRATNRWINGGHNYANIHDFYAAKQTIAHDRDFKMEIDEPPLLLGEDVGANPVPCGGAGDPHRRGRIDPGRGTRHPRLSRPLGYGPQWLQQYPRDLPHQSRRAAGEAGRTGQAGPGPLSGLRYRLQPGHHRCPEQKGHDHDALNPPMPVAPTCRPAEELRRREAVHHP